MTAASVPASAASPLRNQLTLQEGRLGKPLQVQREIKHRDRHPTQLMGCPSFRLFKNKEE